MKVVASAGQRPLVTHRGSSCVWCSECHWSYPQQSIHHRADEKDRVKSFLYQESNGHLSLVFFKISQSVDQKKSPYGQSQTEDGGGIVKVVDHSVVGCVVHLHMPERKNTNKVPTVVISVCQGHTRFDLCLLCQTCSLDISRLCTCQEMLTAAFVRCRWDTSRWQFCDGSSVTQEAGLLWVDPTLSHSARLKTDNF